MFGVKSSETSKSEDENSNYARFLINLNKKDNLDTILNYLAENYNNLDNINSQSSLESLDILIKFLQIEDLPEQKITYTNILDNRVMPSHFLMESIKLNINKKNDLSAFMLSLISIQNRNWVDLHPIHFKLILETIDIYDNGNLKKQVVLEILNELKILS